MAASAPHGGAQQVGVGGRQAEPGRAGAAAQKPWAFRSRANQRPNSGISHSRRAAAASSACRAATPVSPVAAAAIAR